MAIGQKLEEARNRKGISIREASESTKIRGDYLASFESGQFEIDLPEVYLRGFIKVYARFLGIDPESAVADLDVELGTANSRNKRKSLGSISSGDSLENSDNSRVSVSPSSRNRNKGTASLNKALIFGSIGAASLLLIIFIIILSAGEEEPSLEDNEQQSISESSIRETKNDDSQPIKSTAPQNTGIHTLKLAAVGPIERLIICDEGKTPKEFYEYKSLPSGWEKELNFTSSFRCYSSTLENIRFAVDDGLEKQVSGSGSGNFRWQP